MASRFRPRGVDFSLVFVSANREYLLSAHRWRVENRCHFKDSTYSTAREYLAQPSLDPSQQKRYHAQPTLLSHGRDSHDGTGPPPPPPPPPWGRGGSTAHPFAPLWRSSCTRPPRSGVSG